MRLSQQTREILKSFVAINPSIVIEPGNELSTLSPSKSVFAIAKTDVEFPKQAGIYDLKRFLEILSLYSEPKLEFQETQVTVTENRMFLNYTLCDPEMIIRLPPKQAKEFVRKQNNASFSLVAHVSAEQITDALKVAKFFTAKEIKISGLDGEVLLSFNNQISQDKYEAVLGTTSHNFEMIFDREKLPLINRDYEVWMRTDGLARFVSDDVTYFIAFKENWRRNHVERKEAA